MEQFYLGGCFIYEELQQHIQNENDVAQLQEHQVSGGNVICTGSFCGVICSIVHLDVKNACL